MRSSSFDVLRFLADGRNRSGEEIAAVLGLARAAVAQAICELEGQGLAVERPLGRGYRLAARFDALDAAAIRAALDARASAIGLEVLDDCASTNAALAARAACGAPSGMALVCELQHAGRGRRGARWYSGLGTSLTLSLLWRFERDAAALGGLSLAAGVACVRALEALGVTGAALKWPNDVLLGGAKLGGVLGEVSSCERGAAAVIGVGLNVRLPAAARQTLGRPVADLVDAGAAPSRNALAGRVLSELAGAATVFARDGFSAFREDWLRRHAWQGQRVRLSVAPERTVEGVASGVAEDGALIVDTAGGPERFHSAEVSLRRAA